MAPAVFARTRNDMRINREEMFAPITCFIRAGSYDEALAIANDNAFGLTAGIMTRSLARASHLRANMRAGCVMVNLPTADTDYHVPFGGRDVQLRPARTGPLCRRILHHRENSLCRGGGAGMIRAPLVDGLQYANWSEGIFRQMRGVPGQAAMTTTDPKVIP